MAYNKLIDLNLLNDFLNKIKNLFVTKDITTEITVNSDNIITFNAPINNAPLKSLTVAVEPVQDLHGYENPWPGGGGKNLLDYEAWKAGTPTRSTAVWENNGVTLTATSNDAYTQPNVQVPVSERETVTLSWEESTNTYGIIYIFPNGSTDGLVSVNNSIVKSLSYTVPSGVTFITFRFGVGYSGDTISYKNTMIRKSGDATFAPYSNICPISGWTGANVSRMGVNVWDEVQESGSINSSTGEDISSGSAYRSTNYIPVLAETQYYIKSSAKLYLRFYDANKTYLGYNDYNNVPSGNNITMKTPTNCAFFRFVCDTVIPSEVSINYPATDTSYHAYSGTTLPISWQSEAGTVYGGTLDVTTGVLTVTMAEMDLGTLAWRRDTTTRPIDQATIHAFYASLDTCKKIDSSAIANMLSPVFKAATVRQVDYGGYDQIRDFICSGADANNRVWIYGSIYNDMPVTEFKAAMSGVPLVYELAEPTTYQLTPQEITTLLGTNNIWADTGDVSVKHGDYIGLILGLINKKANKVQNATTDNFVALDENGNLKDSGHKHSDYLTAHQSLSAYRTANAQDTIDNAQNDRITDLEQAKTSTTTVGPAPIVTFDASVTDMPLKQVVVNIEPVQAGSGDPSPENVRPISGWTSCNVARTRKNLWPVAQFTQQINSGIACNIPAGDYVLSFDQSRLGLDLVIRFFYVAGDTSQSIVKPSNTRTFHFDRPVVSANVTVSNFKSGDVISNVQIESGSTASAYEPYQGETYSITFPVSAGTVYGGTLDVTNGVLTVTMAEVDLGTLTWQYIATTAVPSFRTTAQIADMKPSSSESVKSLVLCSNYPTETWNQQLNVGVDKCISTGWYGRSYVSITDTSYSDAAAFKTAMNGVQLVYELATPITYQLTPQGVEILTLYDTNKIYTNCGDVTVTYGAYLETLKASLNRTNGELNTLRACIAPIEDGAKASKAYAAGAYFFHNGSFCTALTAISSGAAFTLGTNYQTTTVAAALIALQS